MKRRLLPLALAGPSPSSLPAAAEATTTTPRPLARRPPHRRRRPRRRPRRPRSHRGVRRAARRRRQGRRERPRSAARRHDGLTLYGFVNDVDAISTCYSTCAEAWPPVIVDEEWTVGPGLDTGIFSTTTATTARCSSSPASSRCTLRRRRRARRPHRPGLRRRVVRRRSRRHAAHRGGGGATTEPRPPIGTDDGRSAPATVQTAPTDLGDVLVDEGGMTLYGFTNDADGHADVRGRLRRCLAAVARRHRRAPGRARPGGVLRRRAPRRRPPAQGREVAAVPVRR